MNRLLIVFMIVLLPLRGWASDLMSVQMATSSLAPIAASAMPTHCPVHSKAKADPSAETAWEGGGCTGCDLCVPMAEAVDIKLEVVNFAADASPPMGDIDFASAISTPGFRPPIF